MKRAIRLLKIIEMLTAGPCTIERLADRFDITERTIYRDLLELQTEALQPIVMERVWRIVTDSTEIVTH